jgi:hypothetical protein
MNMKPLSNLPDIVGVFEYELTRTEIGPLKLGNGSSQRLENRRKLNMNTG